MQDKFKETLLLLYPEFTNVLGPYERKDGRMHIVLNNKREPRNSKIKLKTISYPKALMEAHIGKRLNSDDTIDHVDCNKRNNEMENLNVLDRSAHAKLDARRRKPVSYNCDYCGNTFVLTKDQLNNRKIHKFCSRVCSGTFGGLVRLGKLSPRKHGEQIERDYYSYKDDRPKI